MGRKERSGGAIDLFPVRVMGIDRHEVGPQMRITARIELPDALPPLWCGGVQHQHFTAGVTVEIGQPRLQQRGNVQLERDFRSRHAAGLP